MSTEYVRYPIVYGNIPTYPSATFLPMVAVDGSAAITLDTDTIYIYNATSMHWIAVATPGAAIAIDALIGDVMATGPGTAPATITAGAVTLAKMANLTANSIIGNNTGSAATPLVLSPTQVTAMLNIFTSSLQGLVPASGGGTTEFLRADGTFAVPPNSGGTVTAVTASSPLASSGGTTPNLTIQVANASQNGYLSSTDWNTFNNKGSGTVTSVAMTVPSILAVSGSPITTSGTLGLTLSTQSANTVFAGPTSGSAATPTFRSLVYSDLPLSTVSTINSNTNLAAGTIYLCNSSGGVFNITLPAPTAGIIIRVKDSTGSFNTNNVTIVRNGSESIEGVAASYVMVSNWSSYTITSDGTNWFFI